jgi:biotin synthase-related radical SAM superfamily protein
VVALGATFDNPLNTVLPLVLLKRLDDAVIAAFMDGHGLSDAMLEVARIRDRLQPPKHVELAIQKMQAKLDTFTQARRKGADAIHVENRSMKADVFVWLDSQSKFKSNESAATAITEPVRNFVCEA